MKKNKMRIAHSRFNNGKPARRGVGYDRIVTSCWTYDPTTLILRYGATVFTKDNSKTFWNRESHRETAIKRYEETPVLVKLIQSREYKKYNKDPRNVAVDWHIATDFIFKYGVADIAKEDHTYVIDEEFNHTFTYLKYKPKELKYTQEDVDALLQDKLEDYQDKLENRSENNYDGWACLLANAALVAACYYYFSYSI